MSTPVPVLFLAPATGGGHRSAANAVAEALRLSCPGGFAPVIRDPLAGAGSAWQTRWMARSYGPLVRYAPWLWGLLYRVTDSQRAARLLHRSVPDRLVRDAVAEHEPAVIVSFHPLTGDAAIRARNAVLPTARVVTVVTDLGPPHATWTWPEADWIVPASVTGVPVGSRFLAPPPDPAERAALRRRLGHPDADFLVLLVGGAEGAGRLARQASALARGLPDLDVAVICGKNRRLFRRLRRLAVRCGGRLSVHGFVTDMAAWLRAADVVATKAGPGTVAEATCCGAALVLTGHLPGQERHNLSAGPYLPCAGQLVDEIARLRAHPASLAAMRAESARRARPDAATAVARFLVEAARSDGLGGGAAGHLVLSGGRDD